MRGKQTSRGRGRQTNRGSTRGRGRQTNPGSTRGRGSSSGVASRKSGTAPPCSEMNSVALHLSRLKQSSGSFAIGGVAEAFPAPGLKVDGVGVLGLPMNEASAQSLIAVCEESPFGLGEKTIVDKSVRKTWQLPPEKVTFENNTLPSALDTIVSRVKSGLGCENDTVEAKLYKLLLYEPGGHFKPHRDTEKSDGMFATLVIQLPSLFTGGELLVRHGKKKKKFEFGVPAAAYTTYFMAHYADCEHEVLPVKSGYRLALVYSLCWVGPDPAPSAGMQESSANVLADHLKEMMRDRKGRRFGWCLEHKYTSDALKQKGYKALKTFDKNVAAALNAANELLEEDHLELFLVQVEKELCLHGECYGWRSAFSPNGDSDETISYENWVRLDDGTPQDMGDEFQMNFDKDIMNSQSSEEFWGKADSKEESGPTGNEGATRTLWYHRYAIIGWLKKDTFAVMCEAGFDSSAQYVATEAAACKGKPVDDPSCVAANEKLRIIMSTLSANPKLLKKKNLSSLICGITDLQNEELARLLMEILGRKIPSPYSFEPVAKAFGIGECGKQMAGLVKAVGFTGLKQSLIDVLYASPITQAGEWATLILDLLDDFPPVVGLADSLACRFVQELSSDCKISLSSSSYYCYMSKFVSMADVVKVLHMMLKCESACGKSLTEFVGCSALKTDFKVIVCIVSELWNTDLRAVLKQSQVYGQLLTSMIELIATSSSPSSHHNEVEYRKHISQAADVLFAIDNCTYLDRLITTILGQCGNEQLLAEVLAALQKSGFVGHPHWLKLVDGQIRRLEIIKRAGEPVVSWCQPNAVCYGHPKVQAFLRGPEKTFVYKNFNDIRHARNWCNKHFDYGYSSDATAVPDGKGQDAFATITKTTSEQEKKGKLYLAQLAELESLRTLLNEHLSRDSENADAPPRKQVRLEPMASCSSGPIPSSRVLEVVKNKSK